MRSQLVTGKSNQMFACTVCSVVYLNQFKAEECCEETKTILDLQEEDFKIRQKTLIEKMRTEQPLQPQPKPTG